MIPEAAPADGLRIRLAALVPYPADTTPSQRFRIEQWQPHLSAQGIDVDLLPFADPQLLRLLYAPGRHLAKATQLLWACARRAALTIRSRRYDAVLVHRAACLGGPALLERALAALGPPLIFDFDDAIYRLHTTDVNRRFSWSKFPGKTAAICRASRHVVVGNSHLAEYARQYTPRVTVVPTSVDTDRYRPRPPRPPGRTVVGWTGSSTSQTHLEAFAPVLRDLLARRDVELRVMSDRKPELRGVPANWIPWSADVDREVATLQDFDIGIMPVPDDPWSRGKCALKVLQYLALGIATVCSPVGANREVVQHEQNGLLASQPSEWLACLESLVDSPGLRARLGAAGRRTVEASYSARRCAASFGDVVRAVVGHGRAGRGRSPEDASGVSA